MDLKARELALQLSYQFELNKVISSNPFKINFRCHICGDSDKDRYKKRGWFYEHEGQVRYGCFNCDYNEPFGTYLKEHQPHLLGEYLLDKKKETSSYSPNMVSKSTDIDSKMPIPVIKTLPYSDRIDELPEEHPIVKYVAKRKIPKDKWDLLWFTREWKKLSNHIKKDTFSIEAPENRLVIPIFSDDGNIESIQGRALGKSSVKYMTIKSHDDSTKVYGQERVDNNSPVIVLEGPIDSLFIKNGIAITGGSLSLSQIPFKERRIWALDNEPRSKDTCKRLHSLIKAGERVIIWDYAPWKWAKDINDWVIKGVDPEEITQYIIEHSCSGLQAELRFNNWKKC